MLLKGAWIIKASKMNEGNFYINFEEGSLHYSKKGTGERIMLAFHGFGQESAHFNKYTEALGEAYTVFSFDIFYHGKSFWHSRDQPLSKETWRAIISQFLDEHKIAQFSLTGFSMGGKFAFATLEAFPEKVEKIILIAPDGIKTSFWYSLATYPGFFRRFFRSLIVKPKHFFALVRFMKKLRVLDKGVLKFAKTQMKTRRQRRRVYFSWVIFRLLSFDMKKIAYLINRHQIKTQMFLGKHDKIITERNMMVLLKKLDHYDLQILDAGHNSLIDDVAGVFSGGGKFGEN